MIKDNIYQIFIKKNSLNFFNIFTFIYLKILKIFLLNHVLLHLNKKLS